MNKIYSLISLLYLLITFSACQQKKETESAPDRFPTTRPLVVDTTYTNEYVADIQSIKNVEIRSKINGYIEKIFVDEGQTVKAGQLLFSLNSQAYQKELYKAKAMVKSAIAEAKNAEVDLQNVKYLQSKNIVSKTELEKAQANYSAALARIEENRANEDNAAINLSLTQIKAPFDGTINRIPFKAGSLIDEGTLLTTISDNSSMYAYFNVSEKEYLQFASSKKKEKLNNIRLLLASNVPFGYPGIIETVEGEIDPETGNIAFRAKFPNPNLLLKHGSSGKIQLTGTLHQAMIIPQKTTFEIQDKIYVYVVDSNNKIRSRNIKIGQRIPHLYVVTGGLSVKDQILFEGIQSVSDGDKIIPDFEPLRKLMPNLD